MSEDKRETTILSDESNETKHDFISPKDKLKNSINSTSSSQTTLSTSPYIPELDPEEPYFSEFLAMVMKWETFINSYCFIYILFTHYNILILYYQCYSSCSICDILYMGVSCV